MILPNSISASEAQYLVLVNTPTTLTCSDFHKCCEALNIPAAPTKVIQYLETPLGPEWVPMTFAIAASHNGPKPMDMVEAGIVKVKETIAALERGENPTLTFAIGVYLVEDEFHVALKAKEEPVALKAKEEMQTSSHRAKHYNKEKATKRRKL